MQSDAMDFVVAFLNYFDEKGIKDEFDKDRNKMVTSAGVDNLVRQARELAPPSLKGKGGQAANAMRNLDEDAREAAIVDNPKVIDMRAQFSKKIQENGGARGLLLELVDMIENGQTERGMEILRDAKKFRDAERGEDVFTNPDAN